jgi:branched-chain amino acid transport system permease protein
MEITGFAAYLIFFLTFTGIYAILTLGLNIQWGYTGQINIGVAGFFAIGAYTAAILTTKASTWHLGGFGMPFLVGIAMVIIVSAVLAFLIGIITLNMRTDYLAIATIGIAEIIRLIVTNEDWLTNGVRGIPSIPKPFANMVEGMDSLFFLLLVLIFLLLIYLIAEKLLHSPWGRVLHAIRVNEDAVYAAGKNVLRFRVEAFVVGAIIMGIAGALYAHFTTFISPSAFSPMYGTFLVWVMLIAGGSGNNRGAILGAVIIWIIWSFTETLTGQLPETWITRASSIRIFFIGLLLQIILIARPQGLLPEKPPKVGDRR